MTTEVKKASMMQFDVGSVANMMQAAVAEAADKAGLEGSELVLSAVRAGNCAVCERVRYDLAVRLADYLGAVDATVKSVFLFEPDYATGGDSAPDNEQVSLGMNVIVWAEHKSAALTAVIGTLESALSQELARLRCARSSVLCFAFNVQVVDDGEVEQRKGYGAMVDSVYVRPLEVWHR